MFEENYNMRWFLCKKVGALEAIFLSCLSVPLPKMGKGKSSKKKNLIFPSGLSLFFWGENLKNFNWIGVVALNKSSLSWYIK